jgi:hypothetical protein
MKTLEQIALETADEILHWRHSETRLGVTAKVRAAMDKALDEVCKKLNHNTCDGWPDCGSPMCDYNQQLIKEISELKESNAALSNEKGQL